MIGPYILDQYVHLFFFFLSYMRKFQWNYALTFCLVLHAQIAAHEVTNTL
jgi:hypothetical protein